MKNSNNSSAQSCSDGSTIKPQYENERIKYLESGLTDADGYQIPISKSPLQMTNKDNQLLKTMNQIVVLNANSEDTNLRPVPVASVRRTQQLIDSTGSCSPPPTYSQLFKANEMVLNNNLNSCELTPNVLTERGSPVTDQRPDTQTSSQLTPQSLSSSHNQTKNYTQILVKTDNVKPESARMSNAISHSSLSSSPISCSTSCSNSPIIAAALLKSQSPLSQLSQPSRHLIETKYCFNGNPVHSKSVTNSSIEGSEEDYDTDFDTETIAANDLYSPCDTNKQNQSPAPGPLITSFSNPLISSKINDQTPSKYALITRLERKCTSVPSTNNSFHYDTNSSWC